MGRRAGTRRLSRTRRSVCGRTAPLSLRAPTGARREAERRVTELTFVGTSDAFGAGGRRQSAILVRCASGGVLLDCGATTGSGLQRSSASRSTRSTRSWSRTSTATTSAAFRCCCSRRSTRSARKRALRIAGPPGIEARVQRLAAAMGHGLDGREWAFPIEFVELPAGVRSEVGPVRVRSFETHHNPDATPHGMVIERGRREDRLLRRHRLVRRPAAPGRGKRPVHLRVHLSPQRLRLPPLARAAGRAPGAASTAAA